MAIALLAWVVAAATLPAATVPDAELAALRGGFRLPTGIDVALAVQTDTSVNGALMLRSVFTADTGAPTIQVFAPASGQEPAATARSDAIDTPAGGAVSVQFDPQRGVTVIPAAATTPTLSIRVGAPRSAVDAASQGLSVVPVGAGMPAVATAGGAVSLEALPEGARIRLEGDGLDVSHIVGNAFGSVLANTANDRIIDTTTTVSMDLSNVGPDALGSTMFRVENVAVEAAQLGIK